MLAIFIGPSASVSSDCRLTGMALFSPTQEDVADRCGLRKW